MDPREAFGDPETYLMILICVATVITTLDLTLTPIIWNLTLVLSMLTLVSM